MSNNGTKNLITIANSKPAILAEVKCQFLRQLNNQLTQREKRDRMAALNRACDDVQSMNNERFDLGSDTD